MALVDMTRRKVRRGMDTNEVGSGQGYCLLLQHGWLECVT